MEFWSQLRREEIRLPLKRLLVSVGGQLQLNILLMLDSLLRLTIVILLLVNSWNIYQDKCKTGPRHIISAFLSFRHLILSQLTQQSISGQWTNLPIFDAQLLLCLLGMTVSPWGAGVTRLVSNSYCSKLLSLRKKLASAKTIVSKQESRAY